MKGIIYIRVSSDEQVKGTSLDDQKARCLKYCTEKNIEVLDDNIFCEKGASAKTADREELLKALEFCRRNKGKIGAFVVWKVDRFARNTEDHFAVRKILMDYGVTLHSATELIGHNPQEKLFETMLAGFAEFDNAIRRQRCSNGMLMRLRQGIYPWKPPVGYTPFGSAKRDEKKTEPDPINGKTFPIIQKGLKEYAKGAFTSQVELGKNLDQWGLSKIRGGKTRGQLVDLILGKYLNFYAGILIDPETGEEIQGLHKPMITREELYKIRLIRSGKMANNFHRNKFNPVFPLRRTAMCASCGKSLTGSISRGNGGQYPYYHCSSKQCLMRGKCIAKDKLETEFTEHLTQIAPKEKWLEIFRETVLTVWEEKGRSFELDAEGYQKKLNTLLEKKARIRDLLEDGTYAREDGKERLAEVENQITASKISLSEARIEQFDIEAALSYATNFIKDLGRQWFDLPAQLRPRFQKLVFPEGLPYSSASGYGTAKLGLIYEINRRSSGDLSHVVGRIGFEPMKA
jgi:site-specific DNA recombinase